MKLKCNITKQGDIEKLIKELEDYKASLDNKVPMFIERLMRVGIKTAKAKLGEYKDCVVFDKEIDGNNGLLIATDGKKVISKWYTDKKRTHQRSYEISPLLMKEFGSGWLSVVLSDVPGVGQGTMPNSYGHAMDEDGWYWYDEAGTKHHSIGEAPTFPMYSATIEMMREIDDIAKKVFK